MEQIKQNKLFFSLRLVAWMMAVFCFCPEPVQAVSLEWERNSEPTVVGYHLFFGRQSRVYDSIIDVGNTTLAPIPPLQNGQTYFFAVTAYDSQGLESELSEEVSYTPQSANSIPVAHADAFSTMKNISLVVASGSGVLVNDTDVNHDVLTTILVSGTASGTLSLNVNGAFSYSPFNDFVGTDSFTYQITDGKGTSGVVSVTITVNLLPNMVPVAQADNFSTAKNVTLTVPAPGLLANDSDGNGDALSAILVAAPGHGQLALSSNGGFVYSPNTNFSGADSFSYRATDGLGYSLVTLVTITVTGGGGGVLNSPPVANADTFSTKKNVSLVVASGDGILVNDADADHDVLTTILISGTANGILNLHTNGAFNYSPFNGFLGTDGFTYQVTDGKGTSGVVSVTIAVTLPSNTLPVARSDNFSTAKNVILTVPASGLLANDTDGDGDALSAVLITQPGHGQLTLSSNGGFVYSPNANFSGTDSFSYRATDGLGYSLVTSVTVTVTNGGGGGINSPPVANADTYFTTRNQDLVLTPVMGVLVNDMDADHDSLTAQLMTLPAYGEVVLLADGAFVYRPSTNYTGTDLFSYRTTDGKTNSGVANVFISISEEGGCSECLVPLRQLLAVRSNVLADVLTPPTFVPTNSTCLEMELLAFYTVSRQIQISGDAEISAALETAVQCLTFQVRQAMTNRSAQVGELLKSSWSVTASNRLQQTRRKLDQLESSTTPWSDARSLLKSMASLRQVDRYVQSGSVAPVSISNHTIVCKFVYDGHSFGGKFRFVGTSFIFESDASGIPQTGNYSFTRTSWNAGLLNFTLFTFGDPLDISMPLKFTKARGRISGPNIRGTFLME